MVSYHHLHIAEPDDIARMERMLPDTAVIDISAAFGTKVGNTPDTAHDCHDGMVS